MKPNHLIPFVFAIALVVSCGPAAVDSASDSPDDLVEERTGDETALIADEPGGVGRHLSLLEEPVPDPPVQPVLEEHGGQIWARQFGSAGMDMGAALALDARDNIYVAGHFTGTLDVGIGTRLVSAGSEDIFLLKLDPRGMPVWARSFGGTSHDYADDVVVDAGGNVFLSGSFMEKIDFGGTEFSCKGVHDIFVAGFSPSGEHLWSRAFGDREDQISLKLAVDADGGLFAAGWFRGVVKPARKRHRSYPDKATFVAHLDREGKGIWSDGFGHVFDYADPGLVPMPDGGLVLSGGSDPTVEFTGVKMKRVDRMADLGLVLARYDGAGKLVWRKRFPGGNDNLTTRAAIAPGGDILVAGSFNGRLDFGNGALAADGHSDTFLARFDPEGNHVWSHVFTGSRMQGLSALVARKDGTILVTGQFEGGPLDLGGEAVTGGGFSDVYLAAFDPEGNYLWSRSYGDDSIQWPGDMTLDSRGNAVLVGSFSGSIDFQGRELTSNGRHDVFVAKIAP